MCVCMEGHIYCMVVSWLLYGYHVELCLFMSIDITPIGLLETSTNYLLKHVINPYSLHHRIIWLSI